ncbi:MAG: ABC transporter ATP-binding protein, partial [Bacilli bacterium]|nr:ABC transporter ATP-binding protein [Bacilli bacterium]
KLDSIDYDFHEQEHFLDNYTRALDNGAENIYVVADNQVQLIKKFIQSISIFSIIIASNYLGVVYSAVMAIIFVVLKRISSKSWFDERTESRPYFRERMYLRRVYFVKDAIPDIKTSGINDVLIDNHQKLVEKLMKILKHYRLKRSISEVTSAILMSTIYPVLLLIAVYDVLVIKDLALLTKLTVAATTISGLVNNIADTVANIQQASSEATVPFDVLDMTSNIEGKGGISDLGDYYSLSVNNVSFAYTDKLILKDISLSVKKGEKIAIVGENGAGKTTLVKLLLRLYDPKDGNIQFNDYNYKDVDPKFLRRKVGAVFQNSEVYSVTIAENVLLRKVRNEEDRELAIKALKFSGLYDYVSTLELGIDTLVTREFNKQGAVFSGGQQQKLAVARGYAQNYDLFILDEPSSALDPIAETEMYKNMLELGRDKTLIFISHRLSATANVDRIYLFEEGRVLESGTHNELMSIENGKYREMFSSQAEKYLGGENND